MVGERWEEAGHAEAWTPNEFQGLGGENILSPKSKGVQSPKLVAPGSFGRTFERPMMSTDNMIFQLAELEVFGRKMSRPWHVTCHDLKFIKPA